jgi:hypothetical protein
VIRLQIVKGIIPCDTRSSLSLSLDFTRLTHLICHFLTNYGSSRVPIRLISTVNFAIFTVCIGTCALRSFLNFENAQNIAVVNSVVEQNKGELCGVVTIPTRWLTGAASWHTRTSCTKTCTDCCTLSSCRARVRSRTGPAATASLGCAGLPTPQILSPFPTLLLATLLRVAYLWWGKG